ncbi:MAG: ankyrin repeat domain-containing protein [Blastocatellia bacterium]
MDDRSRQQTHRSRICRCRVTIRSLECGISIKFLIELLLARGADLNAQDDAGGTPLRAALENQQAAAAKILRQKGAHE